MSVRAKFRCNRIETSEGSRPMRDAQGQIVKADNGYEKFEPCELKTIRMSPVYGNKDPKHENTKFWQASPTGEFVLGTVNADAAAQFEVGKEYYIDITPAT